MVKCYLSVHMLFLANVYIDTLFQAAVFHTFLLYINTSSELFNNTHTHTDSHTEWEIEILKCVCCNGGVGGLFSEVTPLGFYAVEF